MKTQDFTAGTHLFTATADDGVRVYLEGTLVIDQWKDQPPTTYTASRLITDHELMVAYYEHTEGAVATLAISP